MGPPDCSEGFSDLQSVDHSTLLSEMSKLKPLLKNIPKQSESAYKNYTIAVKAVYNNHALVCEQFVGKGPSLKQKGGSTSKEEVALTAPDSIKKIYKARTLKYINRE